jgi:hypothetical protein
MKCFQTNQPLESIFNKIKFHFLTLKSLRFTQSFRDCHVQYCGLINNVNESVPDINYKCTYCIVVKYMSISVLLIRIRSDPDFLTEQAVLGPDLVRMWIQGYKIDI